MGIGNVMMTVGRKGVKRITWAEGVSFGLRSDFGSKGGEIGGAVNQLWKPRLGALGLF
jgi:hypothetical protein